MSQCGDFHFVTLAFVITMASASPYDSRRHGNRALFVVMNVNNPYLVSY